MTLSGRLDHAWVELPDGTVWEPASEAIFTAEKFNSMVDPVVEHRYTADEAAKMLSVGKHGPWSDEERAKWLHGNPGPPRTQDIEHPSAGQITYIRVLLTQLRITTVRWERIETMGEAGRLIRELEAEREHRKRLK